MRPTALWIKVTDGFVHCSIDYVNILSTDISVVLSVHGLFFCKIYQYFLSVLLCFWTEYVRFFFFNMRAFYFFFFFCWPYIISLSGHSIWHCCFSWSAGINSNFLAWSELWKYGDKFPAYINIFEVKLYDAFVVICYPKPCIFCLNMLFGWENVTLHSAISKTKLLFPFLDFVVYQKTDVFRSCRIRVDK